MALIDRGMLDTPRVEAHGQPVAMRRSAPYTLYMSTVNRKVAPGGMMPPTTEADGAFSLNTSSPSELQPSSADWIVQHVKSRNVAPVGPLSVRFLAGGVSSEVAAVEGPTGGVVVKRSLSRLRVAVDWEAKRERTMTEASALAVARSITPDRVPQLLDADPATLTIVIEQAPVRTTNWREALLTSGGDPRVGRSLGETLGAWHAATWTPWSRAGEFADLEAFEQLRLQPFHAAVARRFPALAAQVEAHAEELRSAAICLVHGDFSPKNVLVGPRLLWVVDFEVARVGHPVFDLAFLGAHLALTSLARPAKAASIRATWLAFIDAYRSLAPDPIDGVSLAGHMACILLARTDGVSPEPGLNDRTAKRARALSGRLLETRTSEGRRIWDEVENAIG